MNKPAGAFAGAERAGKAIQWELIFGQSTPLNLNAAFPNLVRTVGVTETRMVAVMPVNVTRGVVTMMRVRGTIDIYFNSLELAAAFANWNVHMQLQVVPSRDGNLQTAAVLSPGNAADQESNRIIWQRDYLPRTGTTITSPGAIEVHESNYVGMEVDIKVKRRFDRAVWGLALVVDVEAAAADLHQVSGRLRALFKASDGL